MKITISNKWVRTTNEDGKRDGYWGLCLDPAGKDACVVDGVVDLVEGPGGSALAVLADGKHWALRDVIAQARENKNGLTLA